jgi:hypothetical protein
LGLIFLVGLVLFFKLVWFVGEFFWAEKRRESEKRREHRLWPVLGVLQRWPWRNEGGEREMMVKFFFKKKN